MKTMSFSDSQAHYAEMLDTVANDREEVIITRAGHEPVVVVSLEDYESLKETAYLLKSPANARRITDEHRLVYKIFGDELRIASCRYHYER